MQSIKKSFKSLFLHKDQYGKIVCVMKRIIVNYQNLTTEIFKLLKKKYPDGYSDSDVISFKNAKEETIKAVEVRTDETIYLIKISKQLSQSFENYEEIDLSGEV